MPTFDPYRHSHTVLAAAQEALAECPPGSHEQAWATAVVLLRSPLANGTVTATEHGYMSVTVAAAAIVDSAAVRRMARRRMACYAYAFYLIGMLCGTIPHELLPESWAAVTPIAIGIGLAHAAITFVVAVLLAGRALRPFQPTTPSPPEADHG